MAREYRQPIYRPPAGAVDLLLIRHGESEPAQPGVPFATVHGQGDPALHVNGQDQARRVGERLKSDPISAIYVTTLRRTLETAAPLAGHLGLTPRVEPDLREVSLGDWDAGVYRIKEAERDPLYLRALNAEEWGLIPNAETNAALQARVRAGLLRIATNHPDQRVAAFVHSGVIGAALALATGSRAFAFNWSANGSISRLVIKGEAMTLRGFNDCAHLG